MNIFLIVSGPSRELIRWVPVVVSSPSMTLTLFVNESGSNSIDYIFYYLLSFIFCVVLMGVPNYILNLS